ERPEPGALVVAEHARRPVRGGRRVTRELLDVERAENGEIVIAAERDVDPLAYQVAALIRLRSIADDVAEAPHLVGRGTLDVGEHRLECVKIAVDVRDDRDPQGRHASGSGARVVRLRLASLA